MKDFIRQITKQKLDKNNKQVVLAKVAEEKQDKKDKK